MLQKALIILTKTKIKQRINALLKEKLKNIKTHKKIKNNIEAKISK